jgi:quinol monooxygenase YgiN
MRPEQGRTLSPSPWRGANDEFQEKLKAVAMLVVLTGARFDPSRAEKVRAVAQAMIEATRAGPGCSGHDHAFDLLEPDLMCVRELWRDEQALRDRFATPHMAAFLKGLRELKPATVTVKCYELGPERKMPSTSSSKIGTTA